MFLTGNISISIKYQFLKWLLLGSSIYLGAATYTTCISTVAVSLKKVGVYLSILITKLHTYKLYIECI